MAKAFAISLVVSNVRQCGFSNMLTTQVVAGLSIISGFLGKGGKWPASRAYQRAFDTGFAGLEWATRSGLGPKTADVRICSAAAHILGNVGFPVAISLPLVAGVVRNACEEYRPAITPGGLAFRAAKDPNQILVHRAVIGAEPVGQSCDIELCRSTAHGMTAGDVEGFASGQGEGLLGHGELRLNGRRTKRTIFLNLMTLARAVHPVDRDRAGDEALPKQTAGNGWRNPMGRSNSKASQSVRLTMISLLFAFHIHASNRGDGLRPEFLGSAPQPSEVQKTVNQNRTLPSTEVKAAPSPPVRKPVMF